MLLLMRNPGPCRAVDVDTFTFAFPLGSPERESPSSAVVPSSAEVGDGGVFLHAHSLVLCFFASPPQVLRSTSPLPTPSHLDLTTSELTFCDL